MDNKKILILGGGSKLAQCFKDAYKIQCTSLSVKECDITSQSAVEKIIKNNKAHYVLNCAAITDVSGCENDPKKCFNVNTSGVYIINKTCLKQDRKLIHISSDYALNPANAYGWSKYLSEEVVDKKFLIIRTNFYSSETFIIKNLLGGKKVSVYKNVFFNPISINGLVKEIHSNVDKTGILNLFTSKKISYLQFAHIFCEIFKLDKKLIAAINYKNNDGTKRPLNSYVRPDVNLDIKKDLINFKKFYENRS